MTNIKIFALLVSCFFAASTTNVNANKLWRISPQLGYRVQYSNCPVPSKILCANNYTDDNVYIGPVLAGYVP